MAVPLPRNREPLFTVLRFDSSWPTRNRRRAFTSPKDGQQTGRSGLRWLTNPKDFLRNTECSV